VRIPPHGSVESPRYLAWCLLRNPDVSVHLSDARVTGILSLAQSMNKAVAKGARQDPPADSGIDSFEFWLPGRRPGGKNFALKVEPPITAFAPSSIVNGLDRPTTAPNAWVASPEDGAPRLELRWDSPRTVALIELSFDTDFDHPMESVLMGHPERDVPFCVRSCRITAGGREIAHCAGNHQTKAILCLAQPAVTDELTVEILATHGAPAAVFSVRCYAR